MFHSHLRRLLCSLSLFSLTLLLLGCGHTSGDLGSSSPSNQVPLIAHTPNSVFKTTNRAFNRLTISVTVCVPGTRDCSTIDNVLVDTGSVGLRLQAAAFPSGFTLPVRRYADGGQLGECFLFSSGGAWGMQSLADVAIGGMRAPNMALEVVSQNAPNQPSACKSAPPTSNGTLGIGIADHECTALCTMPIHYGGTIGDRYQYYSCGSSMCTPIEGVIDTTYRILNPTLAMDGGIYNGAILDLPPVPDSGADQVTGTLTFGVDTLADNTLPSPSVVSLNSFGQFATTYAGTTYRNSYIDSGTQNYSFPSDLPWCNDSSFYCVDPIFRSRADVTGSNGEMIEVPFQVGMLRANGVSAGNADYGSPSNPTFVWGAPFFFGKRVAIVRTGQPFTASQVGPLYAWTASGLD